MNKTIKFYGIIFLAVLGLLAFFDLGKKEVTDWRKNFQIDSKSPFGLFIFDKEVDHLLRTKVERIEVSPYDYYKQNPKNSPQNILIVQKNIDSESWKKILTQIQNGSDALIISSFCNNAIQDSLQFEVSEALFEEQTVFQLTDKKLNNPQLKLDKFPGENAINYLNKNHEILGKLQTEPKKWKANFIKIKHGNGNLYFHSDPVFISNYYLLQPKSLAYTEGVFSYLKNQKTLWFVDTKLQEKSSSPLSFVLQNPPLKYAWWLFLSGLLVFTIFAIKRKQRVVPVIEPLKNKSVEFVQSIGNLYLQEGDFHDMMSKKSQYFLYRIKMELLIDHQNLDENFAKKLQQKTGKNLEIINQAVELMKKASDKTAAVTREDFVKMNELLDEIYPYSKK
jgi:hypothetical protein